MNRVPSLASCRPDEWTFDNVNMLKFSNLRTELAFFPVTISSKKTKVKKSSAAATASFENY